jgi:mannosyltransferase
MPPTRTSLRTRSPAASRSYAANERLGLLAALVLGAALRLPGVRTWYWGDEIQTVAIAQRPLTDIPAGLERDGAPPLFYFLLHGWMKVFGSSEASTHSLTLVLSLLTVVAAWWFARRHGGPWAGFLAAAAIAANPFLVRYASETRNYALFGLFGVIGIGLALDVLDGKRPSAHLWLGVVLGLTLLTHAWGLFFAMALLGAILLAAVESRDARLAGRGVVAGVIALAVFAPWIPSFVDQTRHTGAPWNVRFSLPSTLDQTVEYVGGRGVAALSVAALGVALVAALVSKRLSANVLLLGGACAATLAFAFVASYVEPIWQARYGIVVVGAALVIAAIIAGRTRVGVAAFAVVIVAMALLAARDASDVSVDAKPDAGFRRVADAVAPTGVDVAVADQGTLNQLRFALGDDAGQDVSYLSPLGELDDPTLYDWRDDLDRLRAADPAKIVDEAVSAAVPGSHFVVFAKKDTSAIAGLGGDQGNEWQQLFTERTSAVQQAALRDARLTPVGTRELEGWTVTTLERL